VTPKQLIDLSQEISSDMRVYPGHLKTVLWEHASHAETAGNFDDGFSFASSGLLMSDHGPTHVDALSHLDPRHEAASIDLMPLTTFYGPGTCIDISDAEPRTAVPAARLDEAVHATGGQLRPGDALLLYTGSHARFGGTRDYSHMYPGLASDAAEWLVDQGVRVFGVDSPSPDNPASRRYPVHMMCRRTGMTHYENLTNLDRIIGQRFTFIGLPLKIRGGTGSPVRAIAVLNETVDA
jgi:kynurenine formamidase